MVQHRTISCDGKVRFDTFERANSTAARTRKSKHAQLSAYHCKGCGGWHVGATRRGKR